MPRRPIGMDEIIQDCQRQMAFYGIHPTKEQIQGWLEKHQDLKGDLVEMGGMDTSSREWMVQVIAEELGITGRWPLGMDTPAFFVTFAQKAKEYGLKINDNFVEAKV